MRPTLTTALLTLLLPLALAGALDAGYRPEQRFERITLHDGLPDNSVTCILQDRLGFLWLGTPNGLVRYDGYEFTVYKPDPDDPSSLSGRHVTALAEDRAGALWIGTRRGGLNRFDRASGTFTHFRHDPDDPASLASDAVATIYEDRGGTLWIGTGDPEFETLGGGLNRFEEGSFIRYRHDPDDPGSLSHDVVNAIHEDRAGRLWVATSGGLHLLERSAAGPETGTFTRFLNDPDKPASLPSNVVLAIAESPDGALWLGTWAGGLVRFDPERRTFERRGHGREEGLKSDHVMSLAADSRGRLWIGTWEGGPLATFDLQAGSFTHYAHDPDDPGSFSDTQAVVSIFEDRTGILWFGTWRGGLAKLDPYANKFLHLRHQPGEPHSLVHRSVTVIHRDRDGHLWVGTEGGIDRYEPATGAVTTFRRDPEDPGSLGCNMVTAIFEGRDGGVWIGTWEGLDRWDPATGVFTHFRHDPEDPASLGRDWVTAVLEDRDGGLWVATGGHGLDRRDPSTGTFSHYRNDPENPESLANAWIYTLYEDREGTLWIGTEGSGLSRFDGGPPKRTATGRASAAFRQYFDPAGGLDTVYSIHEDRRGRLWVGTRAGGLHLFDRAAGTCSRAFNEADGLAHDTVYAIVEDDRGNLWLSTGAGVTRFDPDQERFRSYGTKDGLQSQLGRAAATTPQGALLFGGSDGINVYHPSHGEDNPHPPPVALTGFEIFNQPVRPGAGAPLATDVSLAREITVAHRQNVLTFEFAGLHYGYPEANRYAFRLDPFSHDWTQVGGRQRRATYTNLSPGRYLFRVKAANSDGVWNEEGVSVALRVKPPWWRTWWAFSGYALLALGLVFGTDRFQRARLLRREREEAERREARLRAEAAELQARAAEAQAKALEAENERKTRELEEARRIQLSMLPEKVPWHPDVEIAACMKTATEVGGDYYDFDVADDGTLTLAIGDATGHGTGAGTMVSATKSLFHLLAQEPDVAEVLSKSTRALHRMRLPRLHMALALAKLRDGTLDVSSAGMPPAFVYRAAAGRVEEVALEGMPLGFDIRFPYRKKTLRLAPGDVVVFMSDGFAEMVGEDGDLFGYERVESAVLAAAGGEPREVIDRLLATASAWLNGGSPADDMTFVVMRVKGEDGQRSQALPSETQS